MCRYQLGEACVVIVVVMSPRQPDLGDIILFQCRTELICRRFILAIHTEQRQIEDPGHLRQRRIMPLATAYHVTEMDLKNPKRSRGIVRRPPTAVLDSETAGD